MAKSYVTQTAKYLGMTLDAKLRWKAHVEKKKRGELGLKRKCIGSWEEDRPCRYTISCWCTKKYWSLCWPKAYSGGDTRNQSDTDVIQRLQNKVLRNTANAPWYIGNADLRTDLQMEMVTNEIGKFVTKREERLLHHVSGEAIRLIDNSELVRRLEKEKTFWTGVVNTKSRAQWSAP